MPQSQASASSRQYADIVYSNVQTSSSLSPRKWGAKTALFVVLLLLVLLGGLGFLFWRYHFEAKPAPKYQSPIDIVKSKAEYDPQLAKTEFRIDYKVNDVFSISNIGGTWKIMLKLSNETNSTLGAEHLPGLFKLVQIHMHFDKGANNGSEHLVDGKGYTGEIHLVHVNAKYKSVSDALPHSDGIAVLAVFVQETTDPEKVSHILEVLANLASLVSYLKQEERIETFNAQSLLPNTRDFWTYNGSLTTHPFSECVTWTVFKQPILIAAEQLSLLRQMKSCEKVSNVTEIEPCSDNDHHGHLVRRIHSLNGRTVKASFKHEHNTAS